MEDPSLKLRDSELSLAASKPYFDAAFDAHMFDVTLNGSHLTTVQFVVDPSQPTGGEWHTWGEFDDQGYRACHADSRAKVIRAVFAEVLSHVE